MKTIKLKRSFYNRPTLDVARDLLGKILICQNDSVKLGGRLVELEAYIGEDDPACHACRGRTPRNEIMYGPPGFLYVYFTYGNHYMLNFVTEGKGFPAAVLIRGLEPLYSVETMKQNRGVEVLTKIASGPGKLAKALGVTTDQKGLDLTGNEIFVIDDKSSIGEIWCSSRIGIGDNGTDKLWRFYLKDSPHVSKMSKQVRESARLIIES
ncbi:MAG: DNA-3-methyladenine glycosylase [candidate division Zixibacteria bacterium]|nr:DNA-3-methyladenine glycosylase [candidate division Zixibacteria bacterium]